MIQIKYDESSVCLTKVEERAWKLTYHRALIFILSQLVALGKSGANQGL